MSEQEFHQRRFVPPPDATELILVRHGASAAAVEGRDFPMDADGHGDPELAPEGVAQAERVAGALAGEPVDGLFVSGLRRTVQTAEPIARVLGLEPVVVPDLREVGLGAWEGGLLRVRMSQADPLALRMIEEERWDLVEGAEPMEDFAARVRAGAEQVIAAVGPGARAVVVVHGGVIGDLCRQATRSRNFAFVHSDNCSITRLVVFAHGHWMLRSFNDSRHLD